MSWMIGLPSVTDKEESEESLAGCLVDISDNYLCSKLKDLREGPAFRFSPSYAEGRLAALLTICRDYRDSLARNALEQGEGGAWRVFCASGFESPAPQDSTIVEETEKLERLSREDQLNNGFSTCSLLSQVPVNSALLEPDFPLPAENFLRALNTTIAWTTAVDYMFQHGTPTPELDARCKIIRVSHSSTRGLASVNIRSPVNHWCDAASWTAEERGALPTILESARS
ncbi:hypothetical protein Moror_3891 [Moniliophthora roreri MCA 2997]|uniref:Uncharacterized protein n=2 Tax=Moniliophthora roreri TaxID=221103 RepID=V2XR80_MONRO|nr:hypothetical protein Moror_3891 [Moniliophthora roreri MCA 2997]